MPTIERTGTKNQTPTRTRKGSGMKGPATTITAKITPTRIKGILTPENLTLRENLNRFFRRISQNS
jgi:hypothetical protein